MGSHSTSTSAPSDEDVGQPPATLSEARLEELREVAGRVDELARVHAMDTEVERRVPRWLFAPNGAVRDAVDEPLRGELRAIVASSAVEPRVRALAALRLAADFDLADVPALAPLTEAAGDAGAFPVGVSVPQGFAPSYPVHWERLDLGAVASDVLARLTGEHFTSRAQIEAWQREHPDPRCSFAFWESTLEKQDETTRRVHLSGLLDADPELFVRVLLVEKYGSHAGWWDQRDLERIVREHIGAAQLLVLLRREGGAWSELAEDARFGAFATWILDHADGLFTSGDAAGLLDVWEKAGPRYARAEAAVKLALVAARYNPGERVRIVETTAGYLVGSRSRLVADLVEHGLPDEAPRVERWFRAEGLSRIEQDDVRSGILNALARRGPEAKPFIVRLLREPSFTGGSDEVILSAVRAAQAAGAKAPCPEASALNRIKNRRTNEAQEARARRDCIPRVKAWAMSVGGGPVAPPGPPAVEDRHGRAR